MSVDEAPSSRTRPVSLVAALVALVWLVAGAGVVGAFAYASPADRGVSGPNMPAVGHAIPVESVELDDDLDGDDSDADRPHAVGDRMETWKVEGAVPALAIRRTETGCASCRVEPCASPRGPPARA